MKKEDELSHCYARYSIAVVINYYRFGCLNNKPFSKSSIGQKSRHKGAELAVTLDFIKSACQQGCILSWISGLEHAFKLTGVYCWNSFPQLPYWESHLLASWLGQGSFSAFRDFSHSLGHSFHPLYAKSETMLIHFMVQISDFTLPSSLLYHSLQYSVTAFFWLKCHKTRPTLSNPGYFLWSWVD